MNFTEIAAEVVRVTKRPDKLMDIRREINQAINFFSVDSAFARDIQELVVAVNPAEYTQAIPLASLPRYRRMDYIRRSGTLQYLTELPRAAMLTKCDLRNKWYVAGDSLMISMAALASNMDIAYFAYPPVLSDASPNYWMLEGNWDAITTRATAKIFANIGDTQSAQVQEGYSRSAYLTFRKDYAQP